VARGSLRVPARRVEAKLRYRSRPVAATVTELPQGFELRLDEPAYGVAPGQAAVLYADEAVVGSGTIVSALAE
jgi:tRNA-specific 2-thiouridylase